MTRPVRVFQRVRELVHIASRSSSMGMMLFIFVLPFSTTYELKDFGFGSGGSGVMDSSTYSMVGETGEVSSTELVGTTYNLGPGLTFTQQSNVPVAPSFTNVNSYYNKLDLVLSATSNSTDTTYAIGISTDNFATTNYVQADGTVGATAVYQTYTNWGGASGIQVNGLANGTTYKVKVKAVQTKYDESGWSETASSATSTPSLSFDIDISSSNGESGSPYLLDMPALTPGSVVDGTTKIWFDINSNAQQGAFVYAYSNSSGLSSANVSHTIASLTGDVSSVSEGYGIQGSFLGQTAGGPVAFVSPYDGTSNNVGILDTTPRTILNTSSLPVISGRASFLVKAKSAAETPAAQDYTATITTILSGTF